MLWLTPAHGTRSIDFRADEADESLVIQVSVLAVQCIGVLPPNMVLMFQRLFVLLVGVGGSFGHNSALVWVLIW